MKRLFFCLMVLGVASFAKAHASYTFVTQPRSYAFSTEYDIISDGVCVNTIEYDHLSLFRTYSLCDHLGVVSTGTCRLFSPGALFNSMKEIDVVDEYGVKLGFIGGRWWTTASNKYQFYDASDRHLATAYVDTKGSVVSIVDSINDRLQIATMRRSYVPGGDYYWTVDVHQEQTIDPRVLYVFTSFITDACWPNVPAEKSGLQTSVEVLQVINTLTDD